MLRRTNKKLIMQKLFISIFLIASTIAFSQNNITFFEANARWYVARTYINPTPEHPGFVETKTSLYGFLGDTLISDKPWLKIYKTSDSTFSNTEYLGAIREENGKVYYIDQEDSKDTLYNFNLEVGDSVYYGLSNYWGDYLILEKIDSIDINGKLHKLYYFEELIDMAGSLKEIWIEGIGSIHGPLFPANPRDFSESQPDSTKVTCYLHGNEIYWSNPFYEECYINIVLSTEEFYEKGFTLFPNPVKDKLIIEIPKFASSGFNVSIYDLGGKVVLSEKFNKKQTIKINVASLIEGIYILEIEIAGSKYRQKFVKQ